MAIIPNSYQKPNFYTDQLAHYLTPIENLVLDRIIREILGWQNTIESRAAHIALSVITDGRYKKGKARTPENRLSYGCGINIKTARKAVASLIEFNILRDLNKTDPRGRLLELQTDDKKIKWDKLLARAGEKLENNANLVARLKNSATPPTAGYPSQAVGSLPPRGRGNVIYPSQAVGGNKAISLKPIKDKDTVCFLNSLKVGEMIFVNGQAAIILKVSAKTVQVSILEENGTIVKRVGVTAKNELLTLTGAAIVIGEQAAESKLPPIDDDLATAYETICKLDYTMLAKPQKVALFGADGILRQMQSRGVTAEDLFEYEAWYKEYRAWASTPPTESVIRKTWKQYKEWKLAGKPACKQTGGNGYGKPKWKNGAATKGTAATSASDWQSSV